ncbi:SAGA-associated factor 29 homolog A isoform X2 [Physcomitrium patens]|uniref:SGF29 C-terminal domain-containing protein n=1 Tax=Physcomitrium patens TaxID=3218 RepID=A0A2K1IR31_PHYPA|nr:SAGA-associated factor 29 homolog A-like isoform X2 [Physcomitrium patens]PNR31735.1 hypothetical protein PHYPA_025858 [Physcomitrium patens]|eukprot:XP_024358838.1 SAGA-associated factor 29 homolog A-like isoform X2 [Physcomitrella patens]
MCDSAGGDRELQQPKGVMAALELANAALKEIERLRKEQEQVIRKINNYHSKLQQSPEQADNMKEDSWFKLRQYYMKAKSLAEEEATVSSNCVEHLAGLLPGQAASNRKKPDSNEKKRKRVRADDSTRLSSPTQRSTSAAYANLVPGDQVAARISSDGAENDEWIVVKLTKHDREANRFEVIDEEPDDEGNGQRKYKLPPSQIIPFTKRSDVSNAPDFPVGSQVLAVYPGTTALYKASVVGPQRKKRSDEYSLEFDGDEEEGVAGLPTKIVPFYHVVQLPSGHRQ